jgi:CMP-N,N'-diacetyllegionaminic acid synthase
MKKILGIITARGGSKGIPGKNIKLLGGKPLIAYTINVAQKSNLITDLIVSTDDVDIADVSKKHGAVVPFMRPSELASDTAGHREVMEHGIRFMEEAKKYTYDYVVILQPTSPFRTVEDMEGTLAKLIATGADSAVSIVQIPSNQHPIKIKKLEGDFVQPYCIAEEEGTRRQDLPVAYKRSGAVYAMKRDLIVEQKRLYGETIAGYVVPAERSVDIDYPEDWLIAEYMLNNLKQKGYEF